MDYRMYNLGVPAGENAVELIFKHLKEQGQIKVNKLVLDFVGFEGEAGTNFTLNKQGDKIAIPSNGYFISPYTGNEYCKITSLVFEKDFSGNIYYII